MDKHFWHERWRSGQIGFHTDAPHWALDAHWHSLQIARHEAVLVPLCGKSLDLRWLRQHGHAVLGVELDTLAVNSFFAEWPRAQAAGVALQPGSAFAEFDNVSLWNLDFFDFLPKHPLHTFYDRAALIALPSDLRSRYLDHLRRCLATGATGLLVALEYPQNQKDGPPFSVAADEISRASGFCMNLLESRDILAESPRFRDQGVSSLRETVYRIQAV
ncbi:MAG: thiopurine S-methyltransferase [Wenzhouxiangella sp.]